MKGEYEQDVHILVVGGIHARPDLSVGAARARTRPVVPRTKADEVEEAVGLDRLLELSLGLPEGSGVLPAASANYNARKSI